MGVGELARATKASCFKHVVSIQRKNRRGRARATREGSRLSRAAAGGLALVASHKISQIHPDAEIGYTIRRPRNRRGTKQKTKR